MGEHSGDLLATIDARRTSIDVYLQKTRPRGSRLTTVAIVASAVAAVLTAGPALGGQPFAEGVADGLSLSSDSVVWRSLCFLALAVSVVAAIATNLARSQDTERKIASAETVNAELEGLRTLVEFGQIPVGEAVKQYQQSIGKIPWVDEHPAPSPEAGPVPQPRWRPPPVPARGGAPVGPAPGDRGRR